MVKDNPLRARFKVWWKALEELRFCPGGHGALFSGTWIWTVGSHVLNSQMPIKGSLGTRPGPLVDEKRSQEWSHLGGWLGL